MAESLARVVLAELGFTDYEQQAEFRDAHGRMFVDFLFRSRWTIVEIDGMEKYDKDPHALRKEKRREDRLRVLGYEVVRLTWAELVGPSSVVKADDRGRVRTGCAATALTPHRPRAAFIHRLGGCLTGPMELVN